MSTIYYTFETAAGFLGVYCNKCNILCSFMFDEPVAYWTHQKEQIYCPKCATLVQEQIYRPVLKSNDIPLSRSQCRTENYWDNLRYSNDDRNKELFHFRFCSE